MLRVLVDADNVRASRVQPVLALLAELHVATHMTVSGSAASLRAVRWPPEAEQLVHSGWQQADVALAGAYSPSREPLLLISGDGDFGLLASRHPGPVLVISGAASGRLRDGTIVVDPALDGLAVVREWLLDHTS